MAKRNFNGMQINQSATIAEQAGTAIEDVRNLILSYDENGDVIVAADGTKTLVGIALIEAGYNDMSGAESGKVEKGDQVDVQIKDIGYIIAGGAIEKGEEVTASNGLAVKAEAGNYVIGIALSTSKKDEYCRVQISKYQKSIEKEVTNNG